MVKMLELLKGEVIDTVPFYFKGVEHCPTVVAAPMDSMFAPSLLDCVAYAFKKNCFDLVAVPGFTSKFLRESQTVLDTLRLVHEKHSMQQIILCQSADFLNGGRSNRFILQKDEDAHHIGGLLASYEKLKTHYPQVNVDMLYARFVNDFREFEILQVMPDGKTKVRLVVDNIMGNSYKCKVTIILCIDFRFLRANIRLVRENLGHPRFNMIVVPGSVKSFLEGRKTAWKSTRVAHERLGSEEFIVFQHADCGAFGGSSRFANAIEEEIFHRKQMDEFGSMLLDAYPDVRVTSIYNRLIKRQSKIQFVKVS